MWLRFTNPFINLFIHSFDRSIIIVYQTYQTSLERDGLMRLDNAGGF